MNRPLRLVAAVVLLHFAAGMASAQTFRLRVLGGEQGLSSPFVHALAQDSVGYLWIGTGQGLGRYNGHRVAMFTKHNGLAEDFVASLCTLPDGTVWIGHNQGGISWYNNGTFHRAATAGVDSSAIRSMVPDGAGGIWAVAQNEGLLHVSATGYVRLAARTEGVLWYSLLALGDGRILAGGSNGLHLYRTGPDSKLTSTAGPGQLTRAPVLCLAHSGPDGRILAGTEDEGIIAFTLQDGIATGITTLGEDQGMGVLQVRSMSITPEGRLLVGTAGHGAFEAELAKGGFAVQQRYDRTNGMGSDQIEIVLQDKENNAWFARPGLGLARLLDRSVMWYAGELPVYAVQVQDQDLWLGTAHGGMLHYRADGSAQADTVHLPGVTSEVQALALGADRSIWAGTATAGIYRRQADGTFKPMPYATDRMSLQVHGLARNGSSMWAATSNGVYILDSIGTRHLTTEEGLLHNRVNQILTDKRGRTWMACNNGGVSMVEGDTVRSFTLTRQGNAYHVTGLAESGDGTMWFSTAGNGVWYSAGEVFRQVSGEDGLHSDFCYGLAADNRGGIWTIHRGGVSRIDARTRAVKTWDRQLGIDPDRRITAVQMDNRQALWFGTDAGAIRYDAAQDQRPKEPPSVVITGVKVFGKDMPPGQALDLPPDIYRLQFDYAGISLSNPEALRYRYMLVGHDQGWTETDQLTTQYRRVPDGEHQFKVQVAWPDGNYSRAATLRVTVRAPIWKKTWFIIACALLLLAAVLAVVRLRERNQRLAKAQLQRALAVRTRELTAKKEELEQRNKDVIASITYASRIQEAILPAPGGLTEQFPGAFIFYRPRDIVSGDFYWFRRFGSKFILACADCTGHGVPGAFMSMIGTMLLREVSADRDVNAPDVLLGNMDRDLRTVLHYHGEEPGNRDGMDISLCEIDLDSRMVRFSGAMHDLLVVSKGELRRERGSRKPLGGHTGYQGNQVYAMTALQLEKGDRIYLFSDGMPDQFGGGQGKKMKVNGVMNMIADLTAIPMAEQGKAVEQRFVAWKGSHDQVDDVLLIGVEL